MKKILFMAFTAILLTACSSLKVAKVDPKTGYFPTSKFATVVKSSPVDLDQMKSLLLVPNSDFEYGQMKSIGYFDEVINFEELEKIIIKEQLTDQVPSLQDRIGLNKAAKAYKKFLWFRFDTRRDGNDQYAQYILTDPITLEDIFITEQYLDYIWAGVNDQNTWYPMYNSLIKYIKENSASFN